MAQLISLRSIGVQNVRYERVHSRDALRTPREALLCHIEPRGACKLTTDQSLTGHGPRVNGTWVPVSPYSPSAKKFAMSRNSRRCVGQTSSDRSPSSPKLYWTCQVHVGGSDTHRLYCDPVIPDPGLFRCVRIYPVHVKLWLPDIMGQKKKRTLKQSSCNLTCKICNCDACL